MKFFAPRFALAPVAAASMLSVLLLASTGAALAGPVPGNLGSGLEVLVQEHIASKAAAVAGRGTSASSVDAALVSQAAITRSRAFTTEQDQVKVYIHLADPSVARRRARLLPASAIVTAVDLSYRGGVIEDQPRCAVVLRRRHHNPAT